MKTKKYVQEINQMTVSESLDRFPAPPGSKIQILRPFAVYSSNTYSTPVTAPIGPAYLASILEKAGYKVDIIDALGEGIQQLNRSENGEYTFQGLTINEILDRVDPDFDALGISLMFSQDWVHHRELIEAIKGEYPKLTLIVGGEHPSAMPEYVLRDCPAIDFIITGEGELAFLETLHLHLTQKDPSRVPGVFSLNKEGRFIDNGPGRRISDFGNLPWPAWHLCDLEKFFTGMWSFGIGYGRNMPIIGTRGCPYQCTFCSSPSMWTTRYLMRPPVDVVDEIEFLIKKYRTNSVDFADLTAIIKKEWILEFADEIKRRNLNIIWQLPSGTRSEALDDETVKAIYEAGCKYLVYAPESGSEETLREIKKQVNLDKMVASIREAIKVGHTTKVNLVIGFPNETRRHMLRTLLFSLRMALIGSADMNISIFSPYPGSELFEELQKDGTIPKIDDQYFRDLIVQFDFTHIQSVCQNVPKWEIAFYRLIGMSTFYVISYIFYPKRLWSLVMGALSKKFQPNSLFEQRVFDHLRRASLR